MKLFQGKFLISAIVLLLLTKLVYGSANLAKSLTDIRQKTPSEIGKAYYLLTVQYIMDGPLEDIPSNTKMLIDAVSKSNLFNKQATVYEIATISSKRLLKLKEAKAFAQQGINELTRLKDGQQLESETIENQRTQENQLVRLLSLLAFIETDLENYLSAVENYQLIEKILQRTNEPKKMIANHIGLGDLYNKTGLYQEALTTFHKALKLTEKEKLKTPIILYENMAIVYFNLKKPDSMQYFSNKVLAAGPDAYSDSLPMYRLNYMKYTLANDPRAITEIKKIIKDPKDGDRLMTIFSLAKAYIQFNQLDTAKAFIFKTLETGDLKELTFLSSQLYKLLSDIYLKEKQFQQALLYYRKSVEQLTLNAEKQFRSDNILTVLKYYEIKSKYETIEKDLQVRKNYLVLIAIIAIMIILTLFFLYRTLWIKKRFNTLKYDKLNNEISMINSHEVRRYLCNILGIIEVIKISDDKHKTYTELEAALLDSAVNLDNSIKNIAEKLNDRTQQPPN